MVTTLSIDTALVQKLSMNRIQSYITAIRYIKNLVAFKKDYKNVSINNEFYLGMDDSKVPIKIFNPTHQNNNTVYIIFPGASPLAENHEGMLTIGSILASLGYRTLIPRIPPLKDLELLDNNSKWFSHAYKQLTNRTDLKNKEIAIIGMSFGGAILIKSLAEGMCDERNAKSVMLYGAPYDSKTFINFLLTGEISINGSITKVKQHEWGIIVILHNFIDKINLGFDTALIEKTLKYKIAENEEMVSELINKLDPKQRDIIDNALNGIASTEIKKICNHITIDCKNMLDSISPNNYSNNIKEKVFIVHGANDTMVPYTESLLLGKSIPNNELFISYLFEHKEISSDSGIIFKAKEIIKMIHYFSNYFYYNEN